MDSLIKPDDTWLLWAVILAGVALSIWLEQNFTWAAKISGPVVALCLAMLLSNLHIMPTSTQVEVRDTNGNKLVTRNGTVEVAPPETDTEQVEKDGDKVMKKDGVYEIVQDDLVPLALPLLLFRANAFHIVRTTGWLFLAFHFAVVGTVLGAIVGSLAVHRYVEPMHEVAGIMTGSYSGGAINFLAIAGTYGTNKNLTNPLLVADSFIMAGMFIVLLLIAGSRWAKRLYRHPYTADAVDSRKLAAEHWRRKEISLFDIAAALAVSTAIVALSKLTAGLVKSGLGETPWTELAGNPFVHITAWSMLAATAGHRLLARIHGAEEFGGYLLYVFLFVIGLPADLWEVISNVPSLFVFCLIMAVVNALVAFGLGWLFRLNLEHLVLAVNATLGGPPSAAAMAISKGWSELVLPSILIGIWGYAIGTATGLAVGNIVQQLLSGAY